MTYPIGVTKSLGTWNFQGNTVERALDNATYDAAHPDDTLLLAGPARSGLVTPSANSRHTLLALGMFQSFNWSTTAPVQPLMAIGSGRSFYLRGKSQTQWSLQRVMINGRNLLRALYHNAVEASVPVNQFDDIAALNTLDSFYTNLDSELYYVPFGLCAIIRSKSHSLVASMYFELCIIGTWGSGIVAGQSMIAESVSGLCDRVVPFVASDFGAQNGVKRSVIDSMLGIAPDAPPPGDVRTNFGEFDDFDLTSQFIDSV